MSDDQCKPAEPRKHLWSIVLAGGEGSRTREFIKHRLGVTTPKQYCCFVGTRTLLQHTVDRADTLSRPEHRVVIVAREYRREAAAQLTGRTRGTLLAQPANRGTAPGVFLPLTFVRANDPDATVVIYPSDHFVSPAAAFVESVADAIRVAGELSDRVVLLAAAPDSPETSYGWILPGNELLAGGRPAVREVASFAEKPTLEVARRALLRGGLWNTSIIIARLRTLWELGWDHLPGMMSRFARLGKGFGDDPHDPAIERAYVDMPALDFSRHLLQRASGRLAVVRLGGVHWSDWGSPERILATLAREDLFRRSPGRRRPAAARLATPAGVREPLAAASGRPPRLAEATASQRQ